MPAAVALAAAVAIAVALWRLEGLTAGLAIERGAVGETPVTVFRPTAPGPAPAVVIAHGFAGSQQLMLPFAVTLARNGYVAVTLDLLGHGRNPVPLAGSLTETTGATAALVAQLRAVVAWARGLPSTDGRVALLGHSMATDIVVRAAAADLSVAATVAVSLFSPAVTPQAPRNLLVVVGALEPAMLEDEARRVVAMAAGGAPQAGVTYGDVSDGTARRFVLSPGVEHVGVLYGRAGLAEAVAWLDAVFGRRGNGFVDARGPWLGVLFAGLVALAWPLSRLLPEVSPAPAGAGLGWRRLLPVALVPAGVTPLVLRVVPTGFLPVLVADYLAAHFLLYGVLTAAGLGLVRRHLAPRPPVSCRRLAVAASAVALYGIAAVGVPLDRYVANFLPVAPRIPVIAAILVGALAWMAADEWATRGPGAARLAWPATKLLFLLSLAAAVALDPGRLFFLAIILPVILLFFVFYGLFGRWACRRTNHPLSAALGNAASLAWALGVTFPLLAL